MSLILLSHSSQEAPVPEPNEVVVNMDTSDEEAGEIAGAGTLVPAPEPLASPSLAGKRARPASPPALPGQDQLQAGVATTTTTTTDTIAVRGRSRAAVVSSPDLMERVLGFVAGGSREARQALGRAAAVCRLWREAALGAEVWGRVAAEVLPVVGLGEGRLGRDGRGYMMEQGRCLMERRVWRADRWWDGLRLHLEVWDASDDLRMLSVEGRIHATFDKDKDLSHVFVTGGDRAEVVGPAFAAASRDPQHKRFTDMKQYFDRAHDAELPTRLCVRMVVRDGRTGAAGAAVGVGQGRDALRLGHRRLRILRPAPAARELHRRTEELHTRRGREWGAHGRGARGVYLRGAP
jgi:hypothetical protein